MWHEIFVVQVPVAEKVVRTVLVYATIVILFRLSGKRGLASLNTLDFVVIFLLSNVVQNAIIGNDTSFTGGAIGAVDAGRRQRGRQPADPALARGRPGSWRAASTTVIEDGVPIERAMRHLALRSQDLDHAVRLQNGDSVDEMQTGVLEPTGQFVLSLKPGEQGATKDDIAELRARLAAIDARLAASEPRA